MEFVLIALLVLVVLGFIAYPLFFRAEDKPKPAADALDSLIAQRDSAYDAIRDLDFDFQMGKLSQADYDKLRDKYRLRAAQVLQQIDEAGGVPDLDASIEEQVARLRHRTPSANGDAIDDEVARLRARRRASPQNFCPNCGAPAHPGDRFCAKCGAKLKSEG